MTFLIEVTDPHSEAPRASFDFKVDTVREAATHFEDLTGCDFDAAFYELADGQELSLVDEYGRTVEVRLLVGEVV